MCGLRAWSWNQVGCGLAESDGFLTNESALSRGGERRLRGCPQNLLECSAVGVSDLAMCFGDCRCPNLDRGGRAMRGGL